MPSVLITGSNRGIGLEFARQYAERGWRVIASCRKPAESRALQSLAADHAQLRIEALDIADADSVAALAAAYAGQPIDVLLNNAALLGSPGRQQYPELDFDLFERILAVNTIGTLRLITALRANVEAGEQKKIIILGSAAGSVGQVSAAPNSYLPYRASKAGLHLIARNLGQYLAPSGILVALINPGLVDTRGVLDRKPGDPVPEEFVSILPLIEQGIISLESPADAVANMLARIDQLSPDDVAKFLNADGREIPW